MNDKITVSSTPRTDALENEFAGWDKLKWVSHVVAKKTLDHARQLEREQNKIAQCLIDEFERRAKRDLALSRSQSGVVGFGVTAAFAGCWSQAADVVREFSKEHQYGTIRRDDMTTSTKHTSEPWTYRQRASGECSIKIGSSVTLIAETRGLSDVENEAHAQRIIACVNKLAGFTAAEIEAGTFVVAKLG